MALPSKREFLSLNTNPATNKPFATFPGRGRFSAEAEAFAAANADKFSDAAPKPAAKPRAAATPAVEGAPVAEGNGAERAAAALARREAKEAQIKDERSRGLRAPTPNDMPKRRPESSGYSVVGGTLIRQDQCGKCKVRVNTCACDSGPRAHKFIEDEAGAPVVLTLDKPASLASV